MSDNLLIGLNGRFFPNNWRPALNEIDFAAANGFAAIQFPGRSDGLGAQHIGAEIAEVRHKLESSGVIAVMEILIRVDAQGHAEDGQTPVAILTANLPAITGLNCRCVHFHFVPLDSVASEVIPTLEQRLASALAAGAALGTKHGFHMGLEHNAPEGRVLADPEACAKVLAAIPELSFVWDLNHTLPSHLYQFAALLPRTSIIHVSDTRLPEVNEHLPIGLGTVDFNYYCALLGDGKFTGPAILEIGGLPKSGGLNRDTDEALIRSRERLIAAIR